MKTIAKYLFILLLFPTLALASDGKKGKYTKEKKINKSYTVSPTATLDVTNKYGTIYVTTWDQNQTVIEVVIKVSADKEDQLDKRLNSIDVDFNATPARVSALTRIKNFSGKASMEINYTIKVPKKNVLDLTNQYGAILLGKIYGTTKVNVQYGNFGADELNGTKNEINLQYSDVANIDYAALTRINAQYSKLRVGKAGEELILNAEYTDVKIGSARRLNMNASYGDIKIDSAGEVTSNCSYSDVTFGTISSMLNLTTTYGDIKVNRITKDAREVYIKGQYSDISLKYDAAHAFDFMAKTMYADVNGLQNFTIQEKKESGSNNYYKGFYRSGGSARINIQSEYGEVSMTKL